MGPVAKFAVFDLGLDSALSGVIINTDNRLKDVEAF